MGKNKLLFVIPAMILALAILAIVFSVPASQGTNNQGQSIQYHASVCKTLIYPNGTRQSLGCSPNVLFNTGADAIMTYLGTNTKTDGQPVKIALCNATAGCATPTAAGTESYHEFTSCGLTSATGTYNSNGVGNWSIAHTFTASCNNLVTNVTRLEFNGTTVYFSGNNFSTTTLQSTDELSINWTIAVSGA